jgi:cell division protein FtsN
MLRRVWAGGIAGVLLASASSASSTYAQDDHQVAQGLVDELARDAGHASITGEILERARIELERATRLRALYDEKRARAADGAAREWAETARDLLRAVDAEAKAAEVRRKALDTQAQVDRARALVDEDIARIGRLKAELEAAEKSARQGDDADRRAVEVHEGEAPPRKKTPKKPATEKPAADKPAAGKGPGAGDKP